MTPKFFDAHTHLNMLNISPWENESGWLEVGQRTLEAGISFVNVGADEKTSRLALEQVKELGEGCWATVGIHPTETCHSEASGEGWNSDSDFEVIQELARDPKVVAIGECGLEYYRLPDSAKSSVVAKQKELFIKQIELALELDKPLMIHCRSTDKNNLDAHQDAYEILKGYRDKVGDKLQFNMHFFTGDWPMAQKFLELGSYFSFNGVVTFADQYDEIVKNVPLDRLMSETDAPFVAPVPHRGQRNEPACVELVAGRLAELRSEPKKSVLTALVQNAQKFFRL